MICKKFLRTHSHFKSSLIVTSFSTFYWCQPPSSTGCCGWFGKRAAFM